MTHNNFIFLPGRQCSRYTNMRALRKMYHTPYNLLFSPLLSLRKKHRLLQEWCDDRIKYVFENCRDHDFMRDRDLRDLMKTIEVLEAVLVLQDKIKTKIRIYGLNTLLQKGSDNPTSQSGIPAE